MLQRNVKHDANAQEQAQQRYSFIEKNVIV